MGHLGCLFSGLAPNTFPVFLCFPLFTLPWQLPSFLMLRLVQCFSRFHGVCFPPLRIFPPLSHHYTFPVLLGAAIFCCCFFGGVSFTWGSAAPHSPQPPQLFTGGNESGFTSLHLAAQSGQAEVVRCLLEAGAKSDQQDPAGRTQVLRSVADFQLVLGRSHLALEQFGCGGFLAHPL